MSGQQISGRMAKLKPWHYAAIGAIGAGSLLLLPALNGALSKKKIEDTTAATAAAASPGQGEPWRAPKFPAEDTTRVAMRQAVTTPLPPSGQATTAAVTTTVVRQPIPDFRLFGQPPAQTPPQSAVGAAPPPPGGALQPMQQPTPVDAPGSMGALLKPTEVAGYRAARIPHPWATIEAGRIIACNAATPMTSELPGFVKAKVTYDVRSADGTTTLIDRNSTIFGEIAHGLVAGQERLFVLWRSVTTPTPDLVRITLNAPAADELGESGLPGDVNHHTWKRIGGALMLSGVDALMQGVGAGIGSALSRGNQGGGSNLNFYQFQSQGRSLASALLRHTVEIPDTLHRDQALPCSIFVSGDLDFSSVYQLRRKQ